MTDARTWEAISATELSRNLDEALVRALSGECRLVSQEQRKSPATEILMRPMEWREGPGKSAAWTKTFRFASSAVSGSSADGRALWH
jgi:hypothetical protein